MPCSLDSSAAHHAHSPASQNTATDTRPNAQQAFCPRGSAGIIREGAGARDCLRHRCGTSACGGPPARPGRLVRIASYCPTRHGKRTCGNVCREDSGVTGIHPTRDGYIYISANTPHFWRALCEKTGMERLRDDSRDYPASRGVVADGLRSQRAASNASISLASLGTANVSTSLPSRVMATSSSMRMPIPRQRSATLASPGGT
jgi:hypothetical protein